MSTPSGRTPAGALGVFVSGDAVEAVLVRRVGAGTEAARAELVQRFTRQRSRKDELVGADQLAMALPGLKGADESDYTLQVGDGAASEVAPILPAELGLGKHGVARGGGARATEAGPAATATRPVAAQLKEILAECRTLGLDAAPVAFALAPPDVAYLDLALPRDGKAEPKPDAKTDARADDRPAERALSAADRKRLLALVGERHAGTIEEERVAFVPLAPDADGATRRVLAVVADPHEPVGATVRLLRDQDAALAPDARLLDAEATLLAGLVQRAGAVEPGERAALVRVGGEDTLVLFFDGPALLHVERIRSLTAFDLPETVCSRVLLQVDQKKVGDLATLFLASAGRLEPLAEKARAFFPEAAVEPAARLLAPAGLAGADDDALKAPALVAAAAALRQLDGWGEVNLLPAKLRRRQRARRSAFATHTLVALVALVAVVGVAAFRYATTQQRLETLREEMRTNPPVLPADNPDLLQARVDSLNRAYHTYTRSLHVLDSLLVGSDKWIRSMERITNATARSGGVWIDTWWPQGNTVRLRGSALDRLQVVDLSRRLDAPIELLNYEEIGPRRVYTFEMLAAIPSEMPEVAVFLRDAVGQPLPDSLGRFPAETAGGERLEVHPSRAFDHN